MGQYYIYGHMATIIIMMIPNGIVFVNMKSSPHNGMHTPHTCGENQMIGKRLTDARKTTGLTQQDAALLANIERNSLARYENGRRTPTLKCLWALARVYGIPLDWFVQDLGEPEPDRAESDSVDRVRRLESSETANWEIERTPILRGSISASVSGLNMDFVGVAQVACVAEEGHRDFDGRVVRMVPFPGNVFAERGLDPGRCNVVSVGGTCVDGWFHAGSMVLVDRNIQTLSDEETFLIKSADGVVVRRARMEEVWTVSEGASGWRAVTEDDVVIGIVRWVGNWLY